MANRYVDVRDIQQLLEVKQKHIGSSISEWSKFLNLQAQLYKYNHYDAVLIYAQMPDASAVASFEQWNRIGRRIHKGSHGIGVLADTTTPGIRYLFDVKDTYGNDKAPTPWSMSADNYNELSDQLLLSARSEKWNFNAMTPLSKLIEGAAYEALSENQEWLDDIIDPEKNATLNKNLKDFVNESARYIIEKRLGVETQFVQPDLLREMAAQGLLSFAGDMAQTNAKAVLLPLEKIARHLERERRITHEQQGNDGERTHQLQNSIPAGGGRSALPGFESDAKRDSSPGALEQARDISNGLARRQEPITVQKIEIQRGADAASAITSSANDEPAEHNHHAAEGDGTSAGSERHTGDTAVSSDDTGNRGGNRDQRVPDLTQITLFDIAGNVETSSPAFEGDIGQAVKLQLTKVAARVQEEAGTDKLQLSISTAFSASDIVTERIGTVLLRSGYRQSTLDFYSENSSNIDRAEHLKKSYGTGGQYGRGDNFNYDSKGISIGSEIGKWDIKLKWPQVAKYVDNLIHSGKYLEPVLAECFVIPPVFYGFASENALHASKLEEYRRTLIKHGPFDREGRKKIAEHFQYKLPYLRKRESFDEKEILFSTYSSVPTGVIQLDKNTKGYVSIDQNGLHMRLNDATNGELISVRWYTVRHEIESLVWQNQFAVDIDEKNEPLSSEPPVGGNSLIEDENTIDSSIDLPDVEIPKTSSPAEAYENYKASVDTHIARGAKAKFKANTQALMLLKTIEADNRGATPAEQSLLAQYSGWGGLPQAFDARNDDWTQEYEELKSILTPSEYTAARSSTLNAHYTSGTVISAIYHVLENAGYRSGRILEPSMGTGNFLGLIPDSMASSQLTGVEIDSLTGRLAKQLYPNADIRIQGFEKFDSPDNIFDVVIGNVPFGSYQIADRRYDRHSFLIHDYFFAKALDKVRPGGIVALITSKGTLDKQNPSVRKYIAQRAELLGAIRLPNDTFKANAGTEVTTDILFLQKRERLIDIEPDWIHLGLTDMGIPVNQYYLEHPEMMLGTLAWDDRMYGNQKETTLNPYPDKNLEDLLQDAVLNIKASIAPSIEDEKLGTEDENTTIPASLDVKNFTYTIHEDGNIYYRTNSVMTRINVSGEADKRLRGIIGIRDNAYAVIQAQLNNVSEDQYLQLREDLNRKYDSFRSEYGSLSDKRNVKAFENDDTRFFVDSLELVKENVIHKADLFSKRTVRPAVQEIHADTAAEGLAHSMNLYGKADLTYIGSLIGIEPDKVIPALNGLIYQNPEKANDNPLDGWEPADEYLSGNIREKLQIASAAAEKNPFFQINLEALKDAMPQPLTAGDISVQLGAAWIPDKYIKDFVIELMGVPRYEHDNIVVTYNGRSSEWRVSTSGQRYLRASVKATQAWGTNRLHAYSIIEDSLNMRSVKVYDRVDDKSVLNERATIAAREKQELIRNEFKNWIFKDSDRREVLVNLYNEKFNCIRLREYDGSHLTFPGMSGLVELRKSQRDAVARMLYSGRNVLLDHKVGGGKTYTIIAGCMEQKRLGLIHKPLIAVPNHLVGQWGSDWLTLYPNANILVATKKDFETSRRKRLISRIATGDYDAVIIGHSSFEKIPVSPERLNNQIREQITDIMESIQNAKDDNAPNYSIKQLEGQKKRLEAKLEKLVSGDKKDNVVTFEELGIDSLAVDEADLFKNLFLATKMGSVSGIPTSNAKKAMDMFMKGQYIQEINNDHGVNFATGTPISNSLAEMYTMQRYLQYDELKTLGLQHFDAWASTFGEVVNSLEVTPDGSGFRVRARFSQFNNVPELMTLYREVADIQTAKTLNLPEPKCDYLNVKTSPSDVLKDYIKELGNRADAVKKRAVEPYEDNMLKITNDGRRAALDIRLIDASYPDYPDSKVNTAVDDIYSVWEETKENKLTQLVFCDLSTPGGKGFNIYDDIRGKLLARGIPESEIAFIHNANTDQQKSDLFEKVRSGDVRILMGSTAKMGAGTNVQDRLIKLHHLDVPWRPRDLEQREGRILRQGNINERVRINRYVTEGSFDAYSWQTVEWKQKMIGQLRDYSDSNRSIQNVDATAFSYAEVKSLATGNPLIKEKFDIEMELARLQTLKSQYLSQYYQLDHFIHKAAPTALSSEESLLVANRQDQALRDQNTSEVFSIVVEGAHYDDRVKAGNALLAIAKTVDQDYQPSVGIFRGFEIKIRYESFSDSHKIILHGNSRYEMTMSGSNTGNIARMEHAMNEIDNLVAERIASIDGLKSQLVDAKIEFEKPFLYDDKIEELTKRKIEIYSKLNLNEKDDVVMESGSEDDGEDDLYEKPEQTKRPRMKI